jgi:hypothetical protein
MAALATGPDNKEINVRIPKSLIGTAVAAAAVGATLAFGLSAASAANSSSHSSPPASSSAATPSSSGHHHCP